MKFLIALAALISIPEVHSHGYMSSPPSRFHIINPESYKNDPVYTLKEGPVFGFSDTVMRCRDRPALEPTTTLVAGGTIDYQLTLPAYHIDDCAFYLSAPCSGAYCDAPLYWYKIANFPGCPLTGTIDIPADIPASEHSVFRWEWSAHHVLVYDQVEFYVACHDVSIESIAGPGRPDPLVTIASPDPVGHLSSDDYRDLSTPYTNCEVGSFGCIVPDGFVPTPITPKPTNAPSLNLRLPTTKPSRTSTEQPTTPATQPPTTHHCYS
eukprot:scaffold102616_cov52-Cyclotella_meneghiniana.AAC.1